jgi:hypothetical protein
MIESSKDLLYLVLGFSILWFTIFVCWALYYVIVMLRNVSQVTTSVKEKLELVDSILRLVKEKMERGSSHMATMSETFVKMATMLIDKQITKSKSSKTKNSKKKKT